jgi:hypothetical protein
MVKIIGILESEEPITLKTFTDFWHGAYGQVYG